MSQDLEAFADALRAALTSHTQDDRGLVGKQAVCEVVARYVTNEAFLANHLKTRQNDEPIREVLFEDPELGFCICGHVFATGQDAEPHDHGPSWAVYGQVTGQTVMTDWTVVDDGANGGPKRVAQNGEPYTLNPGDVHLYDVGAVHSLVRVGPVKTIRIEGQNLDHVQRSHIEKA